MKFRIIFALLFIIGNVVVKGNNIQDKFDKTAFYAAMDSGNLETINTEIVILSSSSFNGKDGYEGALLMRKAGLLTLPSQRLKFFKMGRIKLESAILDDNANAEFHFLRFAIQENAPKIVKYNTSLYIDKEAIIKAYKNLPPVVQHAIMDYTKKSKSLHAQDLN